jgi:hypothetical protein
VDYARFVEIATGSVFEVVSQATTGRDQGFLSPTECEQVYGAAEKQSRMLRVKPQMWSASRQLAKMTSGSVRKGGADAGI